MEQLKKIFSAKTRYGRVIRTFIQAFIGICAALIAVITVPEIGSWFGDMPWLAQIGGVAGAIAIVSTVQNYLEKLWDSVESW